MKKNKILMIIVFLVVAIPLVLFYFLTRNKIALVSYPEGIRIYNKEAYSDFFKDSDFSKADIEIFLPFQDIRIKKSETEFKWISEIWSFIRNSKDPYIRKTGSYDIIIHMYFYKENGKKYYLDLYKNYNNDLCFFVFYSLVKFDEGTFFSTFDKEGFVNKMIEHYMPKKDDFL